MLGLRLPNPTTDWAIRVASRGFGSSLAQVPQAGHLVCLLSRAVTVAAGDLFWGDAPT